MRRPEPFTLTLGRPDLSRCEYGLLPRPPAPHQGSVLKPCRAARSPRRHALLPSRRFDCEKPRRGTPHGPGLKRTRRHRGLPHFHLHLPAPGRFKHLTTLCAGGSSSSDPELSWLPDASAFVLCEMSRMWSARATAWTCRPARDGAPSAKAREEEGSRRRSGKETAEPGDSVPKSSGKAVYVLESNRRWEIFPKKETRSLPREDPFPPLYREGKLCQILGGLPAPSPSGIQEQRGRGIGVTCTAPGVGRS